MKAIIVGSGAGGATAARELASRGYDVSVLEAGQPFKPMTRQVQLAEPLRRAGVLGDEKTVTRLFPHMRTLRAGDELVIVRGVGTGGTTTITCGNMVRAERGLREIGLDLSEEFEEIERLVGVAPVPRSVWRPLTQSMYDVAEAMGLRPRPTPKAVDITRCVSCGLCEIGCASGAKWDSRRFLSDMRDLGGRLSVGSAVKSVVIEGGRAVGVLVEERSSLKAVKADVVVLAAGAIGTAQILSATGLPVSDTLWVDVVLTLGGQSRDARQLEEPPMSWYAKMEDYIVSPYFDVLSHWFHKPWRSVRARDRVGVMVKLAESENGSVGPDGSVRKVLTVRDMERLDEGMSLVREVMGSAGVKGPFVEGMLNGGHLGGTVPLSASEAGSMHPSTIPEGLWVADLSLVPKSQGLPTVLTTAALALRVARRIAERG